MKNLILPVFIVLVSIASAQKIIKTEKTSDYSIHVIGNDFEGVIFSDTYTGSSFIKDKNPKYTPTETNVIEVEKLIASNMTIIKYKDDQNLFIYKHLKKYLRQYFGYINEKGQKVICINCFWNDPINKNGQGWLKYNIKVSDGGKYFWSVKINLNTHELFDFYINGEA